MIVAFAILSFAASLALLLLRGRGGDRGAQLTVAAVLVVGVAGYAATGRPALPSVHPQELAIETATTAFETERQARLARFGRSAAWLTFADALLRADAGAMAVRGLRGAIDDAPGDLALWIGLGHALALHGGEVGVASRMAFDRAAALAPGDPNPAFFLGLTQYETGDRTGAARTWAALKARLLPDPALDAWIARAGV